MDWKIGDIAVCVKVGSIKGNSASNFPPLRLNKEYIIQNIYQCPKCRSISLDVGLSSEEENNDNYLGTICCSEYIPCKEIHWCSEIRFIKRKTKEEQLAEAIEKEDYELAEKLTNQ